MFKERNGMSTPHGGRNGTQKSDNRNSDAAGKRKQGPTRPREIRCPDLPLVEEDSIVFRIIPGGDDPALPLADPGLVARKFREGFAGVWRRVPPADRQRVLAHWRNDPDIRRARARTAEAGPTPLIQVVCRTTSTQVEIAGLGADLTFPAPLALGMPDALTREIARALAQVFRLATREHWKLVVRMIEEPLERWERELGAEPTFEERERKLDELEREYLVAYNAQLAEILARWGMDAPERMRPGGP